MIEINKRRVPLAPQSSNDSICLPSRWWWWASTNYHIRILHWILLSPLSPREISIPTPPASSGHLAPFTMTSTGGQPQPEVSHRGRAQLESLSWGTKQLETTFFRSMSKLFYWRWYLEITHKNYMISISAILSCKSFLNSKPPVVPKVHTWAWYFSTEQCRASRAWGEKKKKEHLTYTHRSSSCQLLEMETWGEMWGSSSWYGKGPMSKCGQFFWEGLGKWYLLGYLEYITWPHQTAITTE